MHATNTSELVVAFLGCGKFGTAILSGLLPAIHADAALLADNTGGPRITHLIACVRSRASASRILEKTTNLGQSRLSVLVNDNLQGVEKAQIIILCCRPNQVEACFADARVRSACKAKIIVSGVAGLSGKHLRSVLAEPAVASTELLASPLIVRVMANTAARVGLSTTVATTDELTDVESSPTLKTVQWIFERVGTIDWVQPEDFDTSVSLCGSGPAFVANFLDALIDGAVLKGLSRTQATRMAASMARGTAELMLKGQSAAQIKEEISTPGGSTAVGLLRMEEGAVRPMGIHTIRAASEKLTSFSSSEK